jgi:hypothetical protein
MKAILRKLRRLLSLGGAVAALTAGATTTSIQTTTASASTPGSTPAATARDSASETGTPAPAPVPLKVLVNVPPSWDLFLDDRIGEAFAEQMRAIFEQEGFRGPVEAMRFVEEPARVPYLLTVNLHEWRIHHAGRITCTFGATLQTPQGTQDLGLYTNTTMRWLNGPGRWGLAASFEEAAAGAISNLCDMIARTELVPGLRPDPRPLALRMPPRPAA